jgi:membrane protein implicated in regulation of membrane protease activity
MKPESARTLIWTAGILIVVALTMLSPSGSIALLVMAAIAAAASAVFTSKWSRVVAVGMLIAALALAARTYPAFEHEQGTYRQRAAEHHKTSAHDVGKSGENEN